MINVVSKINGVSNVKSIDSIKPEGIVLNPNVLNKINKCVPVYLDQFLNPFTYQNYLNEILIYSF